MKNPLARESDEEDSTYAVWLNYGIAFTVTVGIFLVDIFVDKGILDGSLIGMLIVKVFDGLTKQNEYFFPTNRGGKSPNGGTDKGKSNE